MITKIYSKIVPNKLLHMVNHLTDIEDRHDICPTDQYLQCATLELQKGLKFKPHRHIPRTFKSENYLAQESFIIIKGKVKCFFYDIDDTIIHECEIGPGDASFTFFGTHNYEILEDSIIYEYKTGPYPGPEKDRVRI